MKSLLFSDYSDYPYYILLSPWYHAPPNQLNKIQKTNLTPPPIKLEFNKSSRNSLWASNFQGFKNKPNNCGHPMISRFPHDILGIQFSRIQKTMNEHDLIQFVDRIAKLTPIEAKQLWALCKQNSNDHSQPMAHRPIWSQLAAIFKKQTK